ncbi:hypothetical protein ACIBSW_05565 [Actinoplanes sp. NPDC049668]|uniref:hypothetical protein n=2 Tax=unclassified Actinoplanes TaxID=2626549 RepID=UPI0037B39C43
MRFRHATLAVAMLTVLGVAGCGDDSDDRALGAFTDGAPGGPSAAADPGAQVESTSQAKPLGPPDVLTAAGIGPYAIGSAQGDLKKAGLFGKVNTKATCATTKGLGKYNTPALAFTGGKLERLTVTSTKVATPTGAKVGTSYADLKGMYPSGKQLDDWVGASAWYALDGGNALLFRIKNDKVASIDAGAGQSVRFFYTDKQGC